MALIAVVNMATVFSCWNDLLFDIIHCFETLTATESDQGKDDRRAKKINIKIRSAMILALTCCDIRIRPRRECERQAKHRNFS